MAVVQYVFQHDETVSTDADLTGLISQKILYSY